MALRDCSLFASVALLALACSRGSTVQPAPDPSTRPLPPTVPTAPPMPKPVEVITRVKGDIEGKLTLRSAHVVVGEPIVAIVEAKPKSGTLLVYVGGDQRNEAGYPTRVALRAMDEK